MLEGKCPKCGYECAGWGLSFPRHQTCARCGAGLVIFEDGRKVGVGYSPFAAQKASVIPKYDKVPVEEKDQKVHE